MLRLPFKDTWIRDITPDGSRMVVVADESFNDLWIVDNFDPDVT